MVAFFRILTSPTLSGPFTYPKMRRKLRLLLWLPPLSASHISHQFFSSFPNTPWLVKVEEVHPSPMSLLNPLSWVQLKPPTSFPAIDLTHLKVLELGQEYTFHAKRSIGDLEEQHKEKVMLRSSSCGDEFSVLMIFSRRLAIFNFWKEKWIIDRCQILYIGPPLNLCLLGS